MCVCVHCINVCKCGFEGEGKEKKYAVYTGLKNFKYTQALTLIIIIIMMAMFIHQKWAQETIYMKSHKHTFISRHQMRLTN